MRSVSMVVLEGDSLGVMRAENTAGGPRSQRKAQKRPAEVPRALLLTRLAMSAAPRTEPPHALSLEVRNPAFSAETVVLRHDPCRREIVSGGLEVLV